MSFVKRVALGGCLVLIATSVVVTNASSQAAAPNKEAMKAMLEKCSREADAKGLDVKSGKKEERKTFRRDCMKKMGVEPTKK